MSEEFNRIFFKKLAHIFEKYETRNDHSDEGIDIYNCSSSELDNIFRQSKKSTKRKVHEKLSKICYKEICDYEEIRFVKVDRFGGKVILKEEEWRFDKVYEKACGNGFNKIYELISKE